MNNPTTKPQQIVIDLDKVRDAQAYDEPSEIIQQVAMREFFDQVNDSLDNIKGFVNKLNSKDFFERTRHHDTITVSGSRGSGKTTFILNMFKLLKDNKPPEGIKAPEGYAYDKIAGSSAESVVEVRFWQRSKCMI